MSCCLNLISPISKNCVCLMQGTLQVCHVVDVPEKGNSDPLAPDGFGGKDLEPMLDYSIFTLLQYYCSASLQAAYRVDEIS